MEVLETSRQLTTAELYKLTMSPELGKMSDHKGEVLELEAWALYKDANKDGEEVEVLSILTKDGDSLATNSPTFKNDFFSMKSLFDVNGETFERIKIISGTSKAGRTYITCAYVD